MAGDGITKIFGYNRLSPESQEQLRLAFEAGHIADKDFEGVRPDLAGLTPLPKGGDTIDAEGYKIDMRTRPAGCRAIGCGDEVVKGELRVGFFPGQPVGRCTCREQ